MQAMTTVIVIISAFIITGLLYRVQYKKEQQKIANLKNHLELEKEYSTPLFNNAGFFVGGIIFGLGLLSTIASLLKAVEGGVPPVLTIGFSLFGLFMVYQTTYIKIKSDVIEFQPLLFKLFQLNFSNKTVIIKDIAKVTRKEGMPGTPFVNLNIYTRDSKKYKLFTTFYNSELGNSLYEFLNGKTSSVST